MSIKNINQLILLFCALFSAGIAFSQQPAATSDLNYPLKYVSLYTDAKGISHFKDKTLIIRGTSSRPTPSVLQLEGAKGATILRLKSGAGEDFHKAPRRQYLFMLQGLVEVTAGDGEKRKFSPGEIMLMEDTTGQGHITKSIGKEDHLVLFVPISDER